MTTQPSPASPSALSGSSAVDRLVASFEAATPVDDRTLHPDVVLDATFPNWRLKRRGPDGVAALFGEMYGIPGRYEGLNRQPLANGELVELTLTWTEGGVPHMVHQAHLLTFADDGRIVGDTMFCGGRWSADLLAEMEAADG